jgi:hypothetical protein
MKMKVALPILLALLAVGSAAQVTETKCVASNVLAIESEYGITVQTLTLTELDSNTNSPRKTRTVTARAYIPETEHELPAVAFSHATIHSHQGTASLLPFANALARTGAAVIVMDRTLELEPYNETAIQDRSLSDCAWRWLQGRVRLNGRITTIGNSYLPPFMDVYNGDRVNQVPMFVGLGLRGLAERTNTERIRTEAGQYHLSTHIATVLKLAPIKSGWLAVEVVPTI